MLYDAGIGNKDVHSVRNTWIFCDHIRLFCGCVGLFCLAIFSFCDDNSFCTIHRAATGHEERRRAPCGNIRLFYTDIRLFYTDIELFLAYLSKPESVPPVTKRGDMCRVPCISPVFAQVQNKRHNTNIIYIDMLPTKRLTYVCTFMYIYTYTYVRI